jgi:hypothetical protein
MKAIQADTAAIRAAQKAKPGGRDPILATRENAMAYLGGIKRQSWYRHIKENGLASVRIGERDFYEYEELDRWAAENKVGGSNAISDPETGPSVLRTQASDSKDPRAKAIEKKLKASRRASTKRSRKDGT